MRAVGEAPNLDLLEDPLLSAAELKKMD